MKLNLRKTITIFLFLIILIVYAFIVASKVGTFDATEVRFDENITISRPQFYAFFNTAMHPNRIIMKNPINNDMLYVSVRKVGSYSQFKVIVKHFYKHEHRINECLIVKEKLLYMADDITLFTRNVYVEPHYIINISSTKEDFLNNFAKDLCIKAKKHIKSISRE